MFHDLFLKSFTEDIVEVCDEWLNSPAGIQWQDDVKEARYSIHYKSDVDA